MIWSNDIDKTSEETADKEQTTTTSVRCALVGAVLAAEAVRAAEVDKEKAAATTAGRQQQRIRTNGMLEMRAVQQDHKQIAEKAEDNMDVAYDHTYDHTLRV